MKSNFLAILGIAIIFLIGWATTYKLARPGAPTALPVSKNPEVLFLKGDLTTLQQDPYPHLQESPTRLGTNKERESMLTTPSPRAPDTSVSSSQVSLGQSQPPSTISYSTDVPVADRPRSYRPPPNSSHVPPATFANVNLNGSPADSIELEIAPGVPVPAALLPADGESPSPIVAAAHQRIADSFVQDLETVLADPLSALRDAQVNDTYFNSLNNANEQYRALYGEAAFNLKTMQATMEAINSN